MLVLLCVWHSIIASIIFLNPDTATSRSIGHTNIYVNVDRYVFVCMFVVYILIHISLIIWLIFVPYKRRREMAYLDREYAAKKHIQLETKRVRYKSIQIQTQDPGYRRTSSNQENFPIIKSPIRPIKPHDGVFILPNATTFLPIREEANETPLKTLHITESNEQDDVFYDHISELKNTKIQNV